MGNESQKLRMKTFRRQLLVIIALLGLCSTISANQYESIIKNIKAHLAKQEASQVKSEATKLLQLSDQNNDLPNKLEALKFLGIASHLQANYDSAIIWYNQALNLSIQYGDSLNTGKSYLNLATSYNSKGDFETAVKDALLSLQYFEALNDKNGQARVQNLLGVFNFNRKDYQTALSYFQKYQDLAIESQDSGEIVSSMNNLASCLHQLKEYVRERQLLRKSISIQEQRGQLISIGSSYENLGNLYMDSDSLVQARFYLDKARKAYEINNNKHDLARLLINTGLVKKKMRRYGEAIPDYYLSLKYAQEGGFLKLEEQANEKLALIFEEIGNYKLAYSYYTRYATIKDSLLNVENQTSINKLMIEYETTKKEKQIADQELEIAQKTIENRKKSLIIGGLTVIIILLLLFAYIIYSRIKIRQERKLNEERIRMKQLQMNAVLESQEFERKRFARDLHDGFGQQITAMKIMLGQMNDTDKKPVRDELEQKSNEILDSMHAQLREIAHNIMPAQLESEGLAVALQEYATRLERSLNMDIFLSTFGLEKRLDQNTEVNLYRIIQEWINNVIKHSGAKKLTIQLTGFESEVNILIEDNGPGFEKDKLLQSTGRGWKNIQSRLEAINGTLTIDTRPGYLGTSFIIDLPIRS